MDLDWLRARLHEKLNDPAVGRAVCEVWDDASRGPGDDERRIREHLEVYLDVNVQNLSIHPLPRDLTSLLASRVLSGLCCRGAGNHRAHRADAEEFLRCFTEDARFYSTYAYLSWDENGDVRRGLGLFGLTFDEGILVADDRKIGVLWLADED